MVGRLPRTPRSGPSGFARSGKRSSSLDPLDREVVALRHYEQLSRAEAALVLGISEEAGAKRYIRAMKKLKTILATMSDGLEGP